MVKILLVLLFLIVNLFIYKFSQSIFFLDHLLVNPLKQSVISVYENFMDFFSKINGAELVPEAKIESEIEKESFSLKSYVPFLTITCVVLLSLYFLSRNSDGGDSETIIALLKEQQKFNHHSFQNVSTQTNTNFVNLTKELNSSSKQTTMLISELFTQITEQLGHLKTKPVSSSIQYSFEQLRDYYNEKR